MTSNKVSDKLPVPDYFFPTEMKRENEETFGLEGRK